MMNLIMLGLASLSRDGTIKVTMDQTDTLAIEVVATGRRARLGPDVRAALENKEPEDGWDPRTIQPYFTTMIIDELGGKFSFDVAEEEITFIASGL